MVVKNCAINFYGTEVLFTKGQISDETQVLQNYHGKLIPRKNSRF